MAREKGKKTARADDPFASRPSTPIDWPVDWSSGETSRCFYRVEFLETAAKGIELSDAVIRQLNDEDIQAMRSAEYAEKDEFGRFGFTFPLLSMPGIRPWYEFAKGMPRILAIDLPPAEYVDAAAMGERIRLKTESALRINGEGLFVLLGPTRYQPGVPGSLVGQYALQRGGDQELWDLGKSFRYTVNGGAIRELIKIYAGQSAVAGNRRVAIALRRFNLAFERHERTDQLIDLWVGLEALFSDTQGDVTYKAALRTSYYVGKDARDRQELFRALKSSYIVRSDLVHGRPHKEGDLQDAYGTARGALKRALGRVIGDTQAPDLPTLDDVAARGGTRRGRGT